MARHLRRNLLLGVGLALGAAVFALGREDDRVATDLGRRDLPASSVADAVIPSAAASTAPAAAPAPVAPPRPSLPGRLDVGAPPPPGPAADGSPTVDLARMELHGDRYLAPMSDGRTAILTIDPAIQAVVEKVLRRARAPRGAVVVTATDGRVLALAGRRTEDPTGAGEGINDPRVALDAWAPSASIFKVVSAAALVEAGVGKSDKVCFHGGVRSVMESNLSDSRLDGRCADLSYGVAHSQNAIIAKLVHQHLTPAQLTDVAHRFGFDRQVALPTPAAFGRVSIPADKGVEFARTAAGFSGVELSAVGGALVANTIATGGIAAPPRLVAGYLDGTGETGTGSLPAPHPVGDRVLEESVADQVAAMMTATCKDGSAARAFAGRDKIPGVAVAGKTGTLSSNEPFYMQYSWFVGFAPADRPTMSISVLLGNPELWQIKAHTAARMVLIEALRSRAGS